MYKPELLQTDKRWKITEEMWSFEDFKIRQIAKKIEEAELFFMSVSERWNKEGDGDDEKPTIIHRDLKYSNFLANNKNPQEYRLIDYELAAIGDKCWDIAEFIFQLLRKKSSEGNIEEDPGWIRKILYNFCNLLITNYYNKTEGLDKEQFFKKVLSLFIVRLTQSYVSSVLSNLWNDKKKRIEFNNIIYFWDIVENHFEPKEDNYFTNYIKKIP